MGWAVIRVLSMCSLRAQLCVSLQSNGVSTGMEPGVDIAAQTSSAWSYWDVASPPLFVCLFVCFPFPWVFLRLTPPLQGPWLFWQGQLLGLAGRLLEALAENEHGICDREQAPLQPHSEHHRDLMEEREHGSTT